MKKLKDLMKSLRPNSNDPAPLPQEVPSVTYYHGGAPGLVIGDNIKARNNMPEWQKVHIKWREGMPPEDFGDMGNTVSITTDYAVARAYAGEYMNPAGKKISGCVYEVTPLATTEPDPDYRYTPYEICRTSEAKIIKVHESVPVSDNPRIMGKAIAPYVRYVDDGAPFYDDQGYIILDRFGSQGPPKEIIRSLGPWLPSYFLFEVPGKLTLPTTVPPLL